MKSKYIQILIMGIVLLTVTSSLARGYDKLQEIKNNQKIIDQKIGQLISCSSAQVNFMLPMLRPSDASMVKQNNEQSMDRYNKVLNYLNGSLDNNDIFAYQEELKKFSNEEYNTMVNVRNTNISTRQGINKSAIERTKMISDANTRAANTVIEVNESFKKSSEKMAGRTSDLIKGVTTYEIYEDAYGNKIPIRKY